MKLFKQFRKDEKGATAIEYGLIAALVSIVIITGLTLVGDQVGGAFNDVGTEIQDARAAAAAG